jgi:hypothetical protein
LNLSGTGVDQYIDKASHSASRTLTRNTKDN